MKKSLILMLYTFMISNKVWMRQSRFTRDSLTFFTILRLIVFELKK